MTKRKASGYLRFIVGTYNQDDQILVKWSLDQAISDIYDEKRWAGLENQVQRHLHDLGESTGCKYKIETWGHKDTVVDAQRIYCMEVY